MKLSKETLELLANFQKINNGIVIKATPSGNDSTIIKTINREMKSYAEAEIMETFDSNVVLYDLQGFININSLFEESDMEFTDKYVLIKKDHSEIRIMYASTDTVIHPEKDYPAMPSSAEFNLDKATMKDCVNASKFLDCDYIVLSVDENDNIVILSKDPRRPESNQFKKVLCSAGGNKFEDVAFKREFLTFIEDDYRVSIKPVGIEFRSIAKPNNFYFLTKETV